MKYFSLLVISCFISLSGTAQNNFNKITGRIMNAETHEPEAFAVVTLLKAADTTLVKGAVSDSTGNYMLENISDGNYLLAASAVGMKKNYSAPFTVSNHETKEIAEIALSRDISSLNSVRVTTDKPLFEMKPGMLVVNVGSNLSSTGNTALEVLQKSPGIMIDDNGNISLKGKQGVLVMIDDKPTYLSAEQLTNLLKSLPASAIQQIEIMTNPPAKYDAAGTSGIINIRMKKATNLGFNGTFNAGYKHATFDGFNTGLNINYRSRKMNLFGSYNYTSYKAFAHATLDRRFYNDDTLTTILTQLRQTTVPGISHTFKAGADFYLNKNNTLGFSVNGLLNNELNNVTNTGNIHNPMDLPVDSSYSDINYKIKFNSLTYDLNYKATIDTAGTTLSADFDYATYNSSSSEDYHTAYYLPDGSNLSDPTIWNGDQPSLITIESGKADFTHPFKSGLQLEAGLKSSLVNSDNNMSFQDYIGGVWINDTGVTNHFKYKENINAAYADLTKDLGKNWSAQVGLRGEQTVVHGLQLVGSDSFSRNYFQLFPTVFVKKDYGKQNEVSFSYSRRIDRPDYQDLNPFRFYVDPYTRRQGNPYLKPQITDAIDISHTWLGLYSLSLDVSRTNGVNSDVIRQVDSANLTIQYKENLNALDNISLSFSAPLTITKWWQSTNYVSAYYNSFSGLYLGSDFRTSKTTFTINSENTFILPKAFSLQITGYYQSPSVFSIFNIASMYEVSVAVKKTFWQKRASLKFSIDDIFNSQHFEAVVHYLDLDIRVNHHWDSRSANVAFVYLFGNNKMRSEQHKTGIEDEEHRVKKSEG